MNSITTFPLRSGARMPIIGLGTWLLVNDTAGTVRRAVEYGYRLIDTSGDYGTQPAIGAALRTIEAERDDLYIVTKIEETDDAYEATRRNLSELGLAYADLVLVHRPPHNGAGEELWRGLIRARNDGLARSIGVSNYDIGRIRKLVDASGEMPAVNQIEWSPFGHSPDMLTFCHENSVTLMAYSPLTRGQKLGDETLAQLAAKYRKTPAQILLRWNIQLHVVPVPKANRLEHLKENVDIFDFEIDEDDMATLNGLNQHFSSLGRLPYL